MSLAVPPRGVTVIVGPSGSGKTSLLRLCNRLEVPTAGTIRYRGERLADLDPCELRRRVGMVFQRPALFGGTVRDNLLVAAPDAADAVLAATLRRAELDPNLLGREAADLSGGEAQRACLARTLITKPEVLLMDEPTASLDAEPTTGLEQLTRHLAAAGVPVLWVTHDLAQARRLADWLVVLSGGRVRISGPPAEIDATDDEVAADFLGSGAATGESP